MAPSLALGVVHPPSYEETTNSPIDPAKQHYLTCAMPPDVEQRALRKNTYQEYWAFRKWIYEHPSSTVAVSPFWPMGDEKKRGLSWKEFQPAPRKPTATKRAGILDWLQQLRKSIAKDKTTPLLTESGTPLKLGDIEYTIELRAGGIAWQDVAIKHDKIRSDPSSNPDNLLMVGMTVF
ncbi:hypothetical protein FALBO_8601 [Fusarium albosuccineum]|uniref:Uncharacterized protein n=1 Tax=Fusarium albosuccineum TaxID=1237068 RepID=A0A8H4L805_9HYPO|nr:hypothetical protein FALBO_8601 [Fusarium albosuccineum]